MVAILPYSYPDTVKQTTFSTVPSNQGVPHRANPSAEGSRLLFVPSLYHNQTPNTDQNLNAPPVYRSQRADSYRHLLSSTQVHPNGMAWFNEADIKALLATPNESLGLIRRHWPQLVEQAQQGNVLPAVASIFLAERIAEDGTSIDDLYPLFSQLDTHPNPLLPIYLAGAYAEMHRPEPFGWAVMQMMQLAINNLVSQASGTQPVPHLLKRHEEMGKLLAKQLRNQPALFAQLLPWLKPPASITTPRMAITTP